MDMTEERTGQALPTATGFGARLTIAVLKKHNVAPAPILGRAGLSEEDFDSRQRRISAASESKCLEYAAEAMDDSAFGLHLAEEANPREAGLPFYIASAANNLGEALALFARYGRIVNEAMRTKLARGPEGVVAEITFGAQSGSCVPAQDFEMGSEEKRIAHRRDMAEPAARRFAISINSRARSISPNCQVVMARQDMTSAPVYSPKRSRAFSSCPGVQASSARSQWV
jgi:hypothetical protein